jgi:hypothetical protein
LLSWVELGLYNGPVQSSMVHSFGTFVVCVVTGFARLSAHRYRCYSCHASHSKLTVAVIVHKYCFFYAFLAFTHGNLFRAAIFFFVNFVSDWTRSA